MSKHTPGPWRTGPETYSAWNEIRPTYPAKGCTSGFAPIAKVVGDKRVVKSEDENKANARLIAAAPELLAALKIAREEAIGWYDECRGFIDGKDDPPDWLVTIDAAIAKAE